MVPLRFQFWLADLLGARDNYHKVSQMIRIRLVVYEVDGALINLGLSDVKRIMMLD